MKRFVPALLSVVAAIAVAGSVAHLARVRASNVTVTPAEASLPRGAKWSAAFDGTAKKANPRSLSWWVELVSRRGLEAKPFGGRTTLHFTGQRVRLAFSVDCDISHLWLAQNGSVSVATSSWRTPTPLVSWVGAGPTQMRLGAPYVLAIGVSGGKGAHIPTPGFVIDKNTVQTIVKGNDWVYVLRAEFDR